VTRDSFCWESHYDTDRKGAYYAPRAMIPTRRLDRSHGASTRSAIADAEWSAPDGRSCGSTLGRGRGIRNGNVKGVGGRPPSPQLRMRREFHRHNIRAVRLFRRATNASPSGGRAITRSVATNTRESAAARVNTTTRNFSPFKDCSSLSRRGVAGVVRAPIRTCQVPTLLRTRLRTW
jgi:hypothetical protein